MRPVIGISCRFALDSQWCPQLVGVRRGYVDAIIKAGGVPLLIPPQADEATLRAMYSMMDGLLLTGGADIDPHLYGEEHHPQLGTLEPDRDRTELVITRWAVNDNKPVLAICRGMQMLNVAMGGTLYQDIPSQYPTTFDHERGVQQQNWRQNDHSIAITPTSQLAALLGSTLTDVNTLHHQALKDVALGLAVVGRAPDGIVEAVEGTDAQFLVGIQCHPEELWQTVDPRWHNVFTALTEAAARWHSNHAEATAALVS